MIYSGKTYVKIIIFSENKENKEFLKYQKVDWSLLVWQSDCNKICLIKIKPNNSDKIK